MDFHKIVLTIGLMLLSGASRSLAAQTSPLVQASPQPICEIHVWQSNLFESANGNAVGGLVGAIVESVVDRSAPPKLVTEQMAQNLRDQELATLVRNLDWSRYIGARQTAVTMESATVDEKSLRAFERSQIRNSSSTSACHIELYVGKQTFQGGMKTWLFSKFGVRIFDAGKYHSSRSIKFTHVQKFPAKSAEQYPAAIQEIRGGFSRNLTKFLDKEFAVGSE
jgi:hypothetical protein